MQSTFEAQFPMLGELGVRLADILRTESEDQIRIKFFEPNVLVNSLEVLDAVANDSIEAAFTTSGYHMGKEPGLAVFSATPFAPEVRRFAAWLEQEGDRLANEVFFKDRSVHRMTCGVVGPEGAGWFKRPINALSDLRGLKMRFAGLGARVMQRLGVSTVLLAGADIYPALERGVIDAAEFSTPYIDTDMDFYHIAKYYYYPGWHQPSAAVELLVNLRAWRGLSDSQRRLIEQVCADNVRFSLDEDDRRQLEGLDELRSKGVRTQQLPRSVVNAAKREWNNLVRDELNNNIIFARAYRSLQDFR